MGVTKVGKLVARAGNGYYYGRVLQARRVTCNLSFTRVSTRVSTRIPGMYGMTVWMGESAFATFQAL